jgi:hypothetical protein
LKRRVSREDLQLDPHAIWNAFVNLLAHAEYEELNELQRAPHLAFWYETEVQNGGHLQFFENRPASLIAPTLSALQVLGAESYVPILDKAAGRWRSRLRQKSSTPEAYVEAALSGEFQDLDGAYYDAQPPMTQLLENYLNLKQDEFILIED